MIRGLHFINEDSDEPSEDEQLAIDLLNPDAVACVIRLVYQRYYDEFGGYFGNVIQAIFTDEPHLLGRLKEQVIMPGTVDSLQDVNDYLGYDFAPYLPQLWDEDAPQHILDDYEAALEHRLEKTYYQQLYSWCDEHNIKLTGHPAEPDDTRHLRYFHMPGQDIVWRFIEPDNINSLEGRQSTQGKAASSNMLHTGKRRNANEFCGAYGHELTFNEMKWLANWLLIRGCNLLIPHAFYYSVRGPRYHERPPDVGLHSKWWNENFTEFAISSRRLCWLNTDSQHICHVAILGEHHHLPYRAAKTCFQNQVDFNYLDMEDLPRCTVENGKLHIEAQVYSALIVDSEFSEAIQAKIDALEIPVIYWQDNNDIRELQSLLSESPFFEINTPGLRVRQVQKVGFDWLMLFNEANSPIELSFEMPDTHILNPYTDTMTPFAGKLSLAGHEMSILVKKNE